MAKKLSPEIEEELEKVTQTRGFRHGIHDFYAHVGGIEAVKKSTAMVQARYLKPGLLDKKTKELLIIVSLITQKEVVSHVQIHMHAAQKAGATPEEILEVIDLVGGHIGNVARISGLEAWRATFRPDVPTIDRVVELR